MHLHEKRLAYSPNRFYDINGNEHFFDGNGVSFVYRALDWICYFTLVRANVMVGLVLVNAEDQR